MPLDFLEDEKMIKALNTALYKAYISKAGFITDDFYRLTEDINSLFFTFQIVKILSEG